MFCPKQHIKTVHFLKISKTTWTQSYFLISPYRIPNYLNEDTWVVYEYGQSHICGGTMCSNRKSHDRKWRHRKSRDRKWPCPQPEVCFAHAQPEVAQYPPSGAFSPEVGYMKWRHFPREFFLVVVQNVGWGVLYDVRVYPFPWLSVPFIFIITYKVWCFRICCVVLQGWYF